MRCSASVRILCVLGLLLVGASSGHAQIVISHAYGRYPGQIRHGNPPAINSYRVHGYSGAGYRTYGAYVPGPIVHQYPGGLHPYDYARLANGLPPQRGLGYPGAITINAPPLVIPYGNSYPVNRIAPAPTYRVPSQTFRPVPQGGSLHSPRQLDATTNVAPSPHPRIQSVPGVTPENAADIQSPTGDAAPATRILQPKPLNMDPDRRSDKSALPAPQARDVDNADPDAVVDDLPETSKFPGTRTFQAPRGLKPQRPSESNVQPGSLEIPVPGPRR